MDTNTPELQNYINAQRANGISDEVIYKALLASGWQHDVVVQSLSVQGDAVLNQPKINQPIEVRAETSPANPVIATQQDTTIQRQSVESQDVNGKTRKKVALIGKIMIGLGVLSAILSIFPRLDLLPLVFAIVQITIGVGILSYNRIAYTLFNILAILAIIQSVLILPGIPAMLHIIIFLPPIDALIFATETLVLSVGQIGFYIYGGIVFHKKEVRALFSKRT